MHDVVGDIGALDRLNQPNATVRPPIIDALRLMRSINGIVVKFHNYTSRLDFATFFATHLFRHSFSTIGFSLCCRAKSCFNIRMSTLHDPDALSDTELMRLAQQGRKSAFEHLIRRHQRPLVNFFRSMGVYNDAEDMAQDTFVRLFKYRKRYKPTAKFTTFLYLMARQVRIDALRSRKRRAAFEKELADAQRMEDEAVHAGCDKRPDVERALRALSTAMREVVVLNVYQGLKYEEIALVLNIPLGTVKSRMFQALKRLRAALE